MKQVLNAEAVALIKEQGYGRVDGILSADDRDLIARIYDNCFDPTYSERPITRKNLGGTVDGRQVLPQVLAPHLPFPELLAAPFAARLEAVARQVLGDDAAFRGSHMILKPGSYGSPTPWHQDQAYHDPACRHRTINFWMPLSNATPLNGCLHFVPRSHSGVVLPHKVVDTPEGTALEAVDQAYWSANSRVVACPAGSATIHLSYMMHYAGPNRTDQDRRALIMVYAAPPEPLERPWKFTWEVRN